jgi:hypothetical protein
VSIVLVKIYHSDTCQIEAILEGGVSHKFDAILHMPKRKSNSHAEELLKSLNIEVSEDGVVKSEPPMYKVRRGIYVGGDAQTMMAQVGHSHIPT